MGADLDLPVDPAILLPPLGAFPALAPPEGLTGSDEHFVPLVVEMSPLVDKGAIVSGTILAEGASRDRDIR